MACISLKHIFLSVVLIASFGVAGGIAHASGQLKGPVEAEVVRVIDGDTLKVRALIWIGQEIEISVRLLGIDTPELRRAGCAAEKEKAEAARDLVQSLVETGSVILSDIRGGKYAGRVLAHVRTERGLDIADRLIKEGLARPYEKGARQTWCLA